MIAINKYNNQHPLRVFEAFAGYGSQSLAFKYLKDKHPEFDFKVVGYSEIEPSAIQAYGLLHGRDIPNFGDVTRIDWNEVPDFDFISWSTHYQQEQTLCPSRKFNSNQLPDRHVRGTDIPFRESLPRQDWSAITLLAYGYFWIYQDRQAYQQSAQSHVHQQDHGNMVQRQPNHRNNARWLVVSTRLERNVGTINVPVRSHTRLIFTFAK